MTKRTGGKREIREGKRTSKGKPGYKTIVIVCEGSKTEKTYFNHYKERNANLRIVLPNADKYTDPVNLIRYTVEHVISDYGVDLDGGDSIWCVCDVDKITDEQLQHAKILADKHKVGFILSNPCFEVWYLLHFRYTSGFFGSSQELKKAIGEHIKGYKKNMDVYPVLEKAGSLERAISNSRRLNKHHTDQGRNLYTRASNPSTQVFELVQHIQAIKRENGLLT